MGVGDLSPGRAIFLLRNPLAGLPLAFAAVLALTRGVHDLSFWLTGCVLVFAGVALRAWSGCLNAYGHGRPRRLATTGPYSAMRNPLYLGSALIIAGACLSAGSALLAGVGLLWSIAVYHVVVLREERRLSQKHDRDYADYMANVPRWLPRRWPSLRSFEPMDGFARGFFAESPALLLLVPSLYLWAAG